jgi:putative ABC transport system permease protein
MSTTGLLDSLTRDLLYALRVLRKNPTFTVVVVLTLAFGIGANTAVFSVVDGVLLKPLSYPQAEQLVALRQTAPGAAASGGNGALNLSPSMYMTFAENNRVFQSLGVWIATQGQLTEIGEPEQVRVIGVSNGVLEAFRVPPVAGRWLGPAEQDGPERPMPSVFRAYSTVMLSYRLWQRRFGGDPAVVGRTIMVDTRPKEIVGVMPEGFRFLDADPDMIFPLAFDRARITLGAGFVYQGVGRLKPGVTIEQANADVARMIPLWLTQWSDGPSTNRRAYEDWRVTPDLKPLKQEVVGGVTDVLWVVMATIGLVMLIACANVANLLLVRAEVRQRELSLRAALGAGRGRIVRGLLVESLLLGVLGGALGVGLAYAGLRLLVAFGPSNLPRLHEISLDWRTLAFTTVLSLLSSALFGLMPALKYTGARIAATLSSLGRAVSASRERHRARNILVVTQLALALVLLVSAGLMIRTFESMRAAEPGFTQPERLQTFRLFITSASVADPVQTTRMENDIQDALAAIPGVTSAAFTSAMPMEAFGPNLGVVNSGAIVTSDAPDTAADNAPLRAFKYASPGYFATAGTRLVAGREITWSEVYGLKPVVTVSENLARELWGTPAAAVGKQLRVSASMPWHEVIGVVQDVRESGFYEPPPPTVYWPTMSAYIGNAAGTNSIRGVAYVVRSERTGTEAFLNEVRHAVWSVAPTLAVAPRTMRDLYQRSLERTSFTLVMLGVAASMALLLGVVGIYGVISYVVSQRTREIAIRAALGAQRGALQRMFVRQGLALAGIGVAIGLVAAVGVTRLMSTLLFGVTPLDPATYVLVPIVLVAATALASYLPARRAVSVDPAEALKSE